MTMRRAGRLLLVVFLVGILTVAWAVWAQAASVTVKGTVLTAGGERAAGARVLVYYTNLLAYAVAEATANAQGRFAVDLQDPRPGVAYQVLGMQAGAAPGWMAVPPGEPVLVRQTEPAATWTGIVRNPEGQPVAGAEVIITRLTFAAEAGGSSFYLLTPGENHSPLQVTSDADGRFRVPDLPPGGKVSFLVRAAGWATTAEQQALIQADATVTLAPEAVVTGRVLAGEQPVAGVTVQATPLYAGVPVQVVTKEDGSYALGGLGAVPITIRVLNPPEGLCASVLAGLNPRPGSTLTNRDFALSPGALLSGRITDGEEGRPLAGVTVGLDWADGPGGGPEPPAAGRNRPPMFSTTTAADGTYRFRVPAGRVLVRLLGRPPGALSEWPAEPAQHFAAVAEGEQRDNLDFALQPPVRIKGRVLGPEGAPAPQVALYLTGGYVYRPLTIAGWTDAEGRFAVEVPPGMGDARTGLAVTGVVAQDTATGLAGLGLVMEGEELTQVRLSPGAFLEGKVVDAQGVGQPEVGALVWMVGEGGQTSALPGGVSDEQGNLRIGPLPAGAPVRATLPWQQRYYALDGAGDALGPFALGEGDHQPLPLLRVDLRGYELTGKVVDEQEHAVPGASVSTVLPRQSVRADGEGRFRLLAMPFRLPTLVLALSPTEPRVAVRPVEYDAERAGLLLRVQALGRLTGQVVDAAGQPVAGAQVTLNNPYLQVLTANADAWKRLQEAGYQAGQLTTDAEGRWEAGGLVAGGPYRLAVSVPDKNVQLARTVDATVQPGETVDLGKLTVTPVVPGAPPPGPVPPVAPTPGAGGPPPPAEG